MKGVILAGGTGSRLLPVTLVVSKQLLPVFDRPTIYYPLATLMLAGIRQILIVTAPESRPQFERLLGDGSSFGIELEHAEQTYPGGIVHAFMLAESFLGTSHVALILGDNIFYGSELSQTLLRAKRNQKGATIFACRVKDPERFGVVEFDSADWPRSIEEKPKSPQSDWAVTGLYFFDGDALSLSKQLQPSQRGELEISDLNSLYLRMGRLQVEKLGDEYAWFDTGTHEALLNAGNFVRDTELKLGAKICCPELVAFSSGLISRQQLQLRAESIGNNAYADCLRIAALARAPTDVR